MKLFQYAVIHNPKLENEKSKLIIPISTVLANDMSHAMFLAGREIPKEFLDRINELDVVIRPFF